MPVASPCTGLCRLNPDSGYCQGCWRSLEEIAAWSQMDDGQRLSGLAGVARRPAGGAPPPREPSSA